MVLVNFVFQFIIVYSEIPFGKGLYRMEIQSIDLESWSIDLFLYCAFIRYEVNSLDNNSGTSEMRNLRLKNPKNILKRISIRYSGDAYSFQCAMQWLIWGENVIALVVGCVGECCSEPS